MMNRTRIGYKIIVCDLVPAIASINYRPPSAINYDILGRASYITGLHTDAPDLLWFSPNMNYSRANDRNVRIT